MNSSNQPAPARKSKGRQKVNMVKMEKQSNLQVTFSKRRAGLFKKASELCTLCGAEAAIVVFSPAEKVYSFGHPTVKAVLDRLAAGPAAAAPPPTHNPRRQLIIEAHRNSTIRELNLELTQVEGLLRAEKRRAEEIDVIRKTGQVQQWIPTSLDDFNYAQLSALKESIMGFKKNLDARVQKEMVKLANNPPPFHHHAEKTENPSGFSFATVGADNSSCVPTFNTVPQLSLNSSGFGSYSNVGIGFSNAGGEFAPNSSVDQASNDPMANNGNIATAHYLRASHDLSSAMFNFVGGANGSSSSELGTDSKAIGNTGFGFDLGRDHGLL